MMLDVLSDVFSNPVILVVRKFLFTCSNVIGRRDVSLFGKIRRDRWEAVVVSCVWDVG